MTFFDVYESIRLELCIQPCKIRIQDVRYKKSIALYWQLFLNSTILPQKKPVSDNVPKKEQKTDLP